MKKEIKKHYLYYLSLILVFGLGIFICLKSQSIQLQTMVTLLVTLFYVTMGIVHHSGNHKLNIRISVEYILIGILGLSLVSVVLLGIFNFH